MRWLAIIPLVAACSFDRGPLDPDCVGRQGCLICSTDDDCFHADQYCKKVPGEDGGYCLGTDSRQDMSIPEPDMGPDMPVCRDPDDEDGDGLTCDDLCPGLNTSNNDDNDGDGAGNECDCQKEDAAFAKTLLDDLFAEDPGTLTAVSGIWAVVAGFYRQSQQDGVALSWVDSETSESFGITSSLYVRQNGDAGLGHNAVGLLIRAQNLSTSTGTAYLCGVNLASPRSAWLARLNQGLGSVEQLDVLSLPFSLPASNWPAPAYIRAQMVGDQITCTICDGSVPQERLCDPDVSSTVSATDSILARGSVGFFTLGTEADFSFIKACGDPP